MDDEVQGVRRRGRPKMSERCCGKRLSDRTSIQGVCYGL